MLATSSIRVKDIPLMIYLFMRGCSFLCMVSLIMAFISTCFSLLLPEIAIVIMIIIIIMMIIIIITIIIIIILIIIIIMI